MTISSLRLLSDLTPPALERTWFTAPHPSLPLVATCSSDKTIRVYSLTNFTLLSTITGGHKRSIRTCAWKPHVEGESVLATGSFDKSVGIWRRWDSYGQETGGLGAEKSIRDDGDSNDEADDNEEEEEWRFAVLLDGHDSEVKSVSWSPSGMLLATCSRDKSIWLWEDLDDGDNNFETVAVLQDHSGDVKCVAWHPVEECLASGSYDDTIRLWREDLDDWGQVACIKGHEGTVWFVDWEGADNVPRAAEDQSSLADEWKEKHALSGPRLISCSDDRTVRIWRRVPNEPGDGGVIQPSGPDENWKEEAILPRTHEMPVYAVAWSKKTGLVATTGADGQIAVFEERFVPGSDLRTEWVNIATVKGGHDIYEINHISWARRADRGREEGKEEEVLVTAADDGSVKVWALAP